MEGGVVGEGARRGFDSVDKEACGPSWMEGS